MGENPICFHALLRKLSHFGIATTYVILRVGNRSHQWSVMQVSSIHVGSLCACNAEHPPMECIAYEVFSVDCSRRAWAFLSRHVFTAILKFCFYGMWPAAILGGHLVSYVHLGAGPHSQCAGEPYLVVCCLTSLVWPSISKHLPTFEESHCMTWKILFENRKII